MSVKALKELKAVADRSNKHVVYIQPEMTPKWQDSYDTELMVATQAALNAGADPEKVTISVLMVPFCSGSADTLSSMSVCSV